MSSSRHAIKAAIATSVSESAKSKLSPLYNLIRQLKKEDHPLVKNSRIKEIKNAFLFSIRFPLEENWIVGLKGAERFTVIKIERHFRIDETYQERSFEHGLTPIHYTEIYSSSDGREIVAHAFLDKNRQNPYYQVKIFETEDRNGPFQAIPVDENLKNSVKNNMKICMGDLDSLFEEWNERCRAQAERVKKLHEDLVELSKTVILEAGFEKYDRKFKELIKAIQEKQVLTGEAESTSALFKVREKIESWVARIKLASAAASVALKPAVLTVTTGSGASSASSSQSVSKKIETIEEIGNAALNDLIRLDNSVDNEQLGRELSTKDLKMVVKRQSILENANELWSIVYGFLEKKLWVNKEQQKVDKLLNRVSEKLEKHNRQCRAFLKFMALEGEWEGVKPLFQLLKDKLKDDFYESFIEQLISAKSKIEQEKIIAVCNYFYENSENYKSCVFNMSRESSYLLSKKDAQTIDQDLNAEYYVSLLYKAYFDKNITVFDMLLKHGADINAWGIKRDYPFSLLYSIAMFEKPGYLDYLERLLHYNAKAELILSPELNRRLNQIKLDNQKEISKARLELRKKSFVIGSMKETFSLIPLIMMMADRKSPAGLNLLLPYSSTQNVANCLALLSLTNNFGMRLFPSNETPFIGFAENRTLAIAQENALCSGEVMSYLPGFIIYPNENSDVSVGININQVKAVHQKLCERVEKTSNHEFDRIYDELFKYGTEHLVQKKWPLAMYAFRGCEYLLAEKCQRLDQKERLVLLGKYLVKLNLSIIEIASNGRDGEYRKMMTEQYQARISAYREAEKQKNSRAQNKKPIESEGFNVGISPAHLNLINNPMISLAYDLGSLSANQDFMTMFSATKEPGLLFCKSQAEASLVQEQIPLETRRLVKYEYKTPFLTFITYPLGEEELCDVDKAYVELWIEQAREAQKALREKIKLLKNDQEFDLVYNQLFQYGCERLSKEDLSRAMGALHGCEYLLIERCRFLNKDQQLDLFKRYGIEISRAWLPMLELKYSNDREDKFLEYLLTLHKNRIHSCKSVFNDAERAIVNNACLVAFKQTADFLRCPSAKKDKNVVEVLERFAEVVNILGETHQSAQDSHYDPDKLRQLESISNGVSLCMTYGYERARTIVGSNQVLTAIRAPFLPGSLERWVQSWAWETWKEKYNTDYPEKVRNGYGPGALTLRKK